MARPRRAGPGAAATALRLSALILLAGLQACAPQAPPPRNCAEAVARANADPRLRIQGGSDDAVNAREIAKVHIYQAGAAAASGNEAECWRQLNAVYLR
jgi:hypothetical protein